MVSGWSKHSRPDTRVYNVVMQPQRSTYKCQLGSLVPRLLPMYKNGESPHVQKWGESLEDFHVPYCATVCDFVCGFVLPMHSDSKYCPAL